MKEKILNIIVIIISLFVLGQLLINKTIIYSSIMYALNLWVESLVPALFPFFIISDILINYNIMEYIPKIIKECCKRLFNISDNMLIILLLSLISGFPSNARNTRTLYDKGMISLDEANHIMIFSHFANPIFILITIAEFFFHNKQMGIILLIAHYGSNLLLGILFRNKFKHNERVKYKQENNLNFGELFILAIQKAIDTILMICGIVVVFSMLATIVVNTFSFNAYNEMMVKGLFEITIGMQALSNLPINLVYKAVIASCILSFGGISVHVQVLSQIVGTDIKYLYFLMGRMYQLIIAGVITYIIYLFVGI